MCSLRLWKSTHKSAKSRQKMRHKKSQPLKISQLALSKVPRAGIEPARPFRAKGFSYCYGFRHRMRRLRLRSVCSPDYSFAMDASSLGVSCLVSAPSSTGRLGSRLPSALSVKASLNLRHSTSLLSERALKSLSPSCLPFHHQGGFEGKDKKNIGKSVSLQT